MKKLWTKLKGLRPTKRKIIQLYFALLFNANLKGFINGQIYKGPLKNICTPGLNCYSCPGASGACPLGSLQNSFGAVERRTPFYVIGIILLYGIILGRTICGFLCPFGFIQELLHKIKTPKLKKSRITRIFSYLKYVILVFFVIIVPIMYGLRDVPLPAFCKFICPAGTLEGAMGLLSNKVNESLLSSLGPLFTWKFALLVSTVLASIFIFRFFCRFICPLGALYGLFNKFSVLGVKVDKPRCTDCGLCVSKCQMDIRKVGDHECISCGECISVCPTSAISFKGSKIILPPDEIDTANKESDEVTEYRRAYGEKMKKRAKIVKTVIGALAAALLIGALVYYNFIDKAPEGPVIDNGGEGGENELVVGNKVGNLCPDIEFKVFDENGLSGTTINPTKNPGKITIINFWGTWCSGCVKELPYFDRIATEYKDSVTVIAVHSELDFALTAAPYVNVHYKDSDIIFAKDEPIDPNNKYGDDIYFKMLGGGDNYPITIILDENGVITNSYLRDVTYDELKGAIEAQLGGEGEGAGSGSENANKTTYSVSVVDENGSPVKNVYIQLCQGELCFKTPLVTDENGSASKELDTKDEAVKITVLQVEGDGYVITGEPVYFADGSTTVTVVLTSK